MLSTCQRRKEGCLESIHNGSGHKPESDEDQVRRGGGGVGKPSGEHSRSEQFMFYVSSCHFSVVAKLRTLYGDARLICTQRGFLVSFSLSIAV
jgi:hypothetical protein